MPNIKTQLEVAQHIANRGSKALLEIEGLGYKVRNVLESNISPEAKVEVLTRLNDEIMVKVMEGTSSAYKIDTNA